MYNRVEIIGNLGRNPDMRYTPKGTAVCDFSVATKGWNDATVWWKVTAWAKLAETCNEYLAKGRQVFIAGEIKADDSGNPVVFQRKDGTWGASFELTAREVKFLGSREQRQAQQTVDEAFGEDDDVPPF